MSENRAEARFRRDLGAAEELLRRWMDLHLLILPCGQERVETLARDTQEWLEAEP